MATIVMSGPQNVTLDGVVQDPDGREGWEHGGWFAEYGGADLGPWGQIALEEANGAAAWLLGRKSYEFFATRWASRDGELADRLRAIPKYVVSSTLNDPPGATPRARRRRGRGGEPRQSRGGRRDRHPGQPSARPYAMQHGLVDEIRLVVFPVVLGMGDASSEPMAARYRCTLRTHAGSVKDWCCSPTRSPPPRWGRRDRDRLRVLACRDGVALPHWRLPARPTGLDIQLIEATFTSPSPLCSSPLSYSPFAACSESPRE